MAGNKARIVGTFEEYADYYRIKNTNPYERFAQMVRKQCINLDNSHILDIGCGGAVLMDLLATHFKEITLVEPNPYFRTRWFNKSWINDNKHVLHLHPLTIENTVKRDLIKRNSIDAIIIFHSIYHFNLEILDNTIASCISYLKANGVCIISLIDDNDKFAKIYRKLSPNYKLCTDIENILKTMDNINYEKEYTISEYNMNYDVHLKMLQWSFIQDAMNTNYFPNGLTNRQVNAINVECQKFIEEYTKRSVVKDQNGNDMFMYKNGYRSVHFTIHKNIFSKL
eukprot:475520_1